MGWRKVLAWVVVVSAGCSGADFSVAGGSAGDSAAAGDMGTGGETAIDGPVGGDAGGCMRGSDCAPGLFCELLDCVGPGHCRPMPAPSADFAPVCGCDGITYWNQPLLASRSVGVRAPGSCDVRSDRMSCTGDFCDGGVCVHEVDVALACPTAPLKGACWRVPPTTNCPGLTGPTVKTCEDKCTTQCQAVKDKKAFFQTKCAPG